MDLLFSLCSFDPQTRATARNVLHSPFMADLREAPGTKYPDGTTVRSYTTAMKGIPPSSRHCRATHDGLGNDTSPVSDRTMNTNSCNVFHIATGTLAMQSRSDPSPNWHAKRWKRVSMGTCVGKVGISINAIRSSHIFVSDSLRAFVSAM